MLRAKNGRLEIHEDNHAFYALDTLTGEIKELGNGKKMIVNGETGGFVEVGTPRFYASLRADVRWNKWELMMAIFGVSQAEAPQGRMRTKKV